MRCRVSSPEKSKLDGPFVGGPSSDKEGKSILRSIRGAITLLVATFAFLVADLIQRTLVVVVIATLPRLRDRVLTLWVRIVNTVVMGLIAGVGGARVDLRARIPGEEGVLVLMNHQSLLDIPIAIHCVDGGYPKIVARDRYRRGYPLISHMIRLYGHPTVRPGEHAMVQLETLKKTARESDRALVIYPEGGRTPDGEIRRFKTAGLKAILSARPWSVYLLVADGMWSVAGLGEFVRNISASVIRTESEGPFSFDNHETDADEFIASMERRMTGRLARMREPTSGG